LSLFLFAIGLISLYLMATGVRCCLAAQCTAYG
jgi:hypothetical protein